MLDDLKPLKRTPKDREKWRLKTLQYDLDCGFIDLLHRDIQEWGFDLRNSDSPEVRDKFAWFEREATRCSAIEAEHGKGSLLNLDHPFIKRSMGNPRIATLEQLEAARSYRRAMEIAG
jgi:hypothetical protein